MWRLLLALLPLVASAQTPEPSPAEPASPPPAEAPAPTPTEPPPTEPGPAPQGAPVGEPSSAPPEPPPPPKKRRPRPDAGSTTALPQPPSSPSATPPPTSPASAPASASSIPSLPAVPAPKAPAPAAPTPQPASPPESLATQNPELLIQARRFFAHLSQGDARALVEQSALPFQLETRSITRSDELLAEWLKSLRVKRTDLLNLYSFEVLSPAEMGRKYGKPPARLQAFPWNGAKSMVVVANLSGHAAIVVFRESQGEWKAVAYHD